MREPTIILGVDPGLADTGYGIIAQNGSKMECLQYGVIKTPAHTDQGYRLSVIFDQMISIIREYQPDEAGIETLYFAKNVTSGLQVAEARGIVLLALAQHHIRVGEFAPNAIKKTVTGIAQAQKKQVQESVKILLGLKKLPSPSHAADALAAAITQGNAKAFSQSFDLNQII